MYIICLILTINNRFFKFYNHFIERETEAQKTKSLIQQRMVEPKIHVRIISRQHTALKALHCVTFVYYVF